MNDNDARREHAGTTRRPATTGRRWTMRMLTVVALVVAQVVALPVLTTSFSGVASAANSMTVVKSADPVDGSSVSVGNTITYSVEVTNTGDEPLTFPTIGDTLPAGVTYVPGSSTITGARQVRQYRDEFDLERYDNSNGVTDWSGSPWIEPFDGGSATGGDINIDVDKDQPVDEEFVLVFKGKDEQIYRPMDLGGCVSARITFDWRPKDDVLNTRFAALEFFDGASWTRQQTFQGAKRDSYTTYTQLIPAQFLVAGARLRFRGSADMDKEIFFDNVEIDAACAIVPAGTAVGAPNALVQTGDNYAIAPGETATVTFEVTVDPTVAKGDVLTNTAKAATSEVSTVGSNSVSHTVVTTPSLLGTVYFDANASNDLDAGDPAIGEPLWAKLISGGTAVQVVPVDLATGTYEFVEVDGGAYTIVIDDNNSAGDTTPNLPSDWTNANPASGALAVVSGGDGAPNVTGLDFGLSRSADLELTKTIDDATPYAGGTVNYTLTLTNQGPAATSQVVVRDRLPAGVTYISHAGSGSFDPGTGEWAVANLASGQAASISILATVDAAPLGTVVTNDAEVVAMFAIDPDSTPDNGVPGEDDIATVDFTVSPPPQAEIALTKNVDVAIAGIGDAVAYTIQLTNNGPDPVSGGTVTDLLPPILEFQTFSTTPIANGTYNVGTGIWQFGALAVGASTTLTINSTVKDLGFANTPGTVTNSATVDVAPAEDTVPANDTDSASFDIPRADLELVKQVNGAGAATVEILDNLTFRLTLTNRGPDPITDVVIDDVLPSGLIFQGTTASLGSYGQGLWTIPNMPVGTATLDIDVTAASGGVIRNVAEVVDMVGIDPDSIVGNRVFSEDDLDDVLVTVTNNGNITPGLPGSICFPIGDEVGSFGVADLLTRVDKDTSVEEAISPGGNGTGTRNIESSAIDPETGLLYTADGGTFGTIDLDTGRFTAIANIGSGGGYNQFGNRQSIGFSDIDGMHFDLLTGALFASVRREGSNWDLLIQINPATGKAVPNAFDSDGNPATTEEYVVIEPVVSSGSTLRDIDAVAVDLDGTLYGAANGSSTTDQVLVRINKITGTTTTVGIVYHNGSKIRDIEGMSFDNQGLLYITTGNGGGVQSGFYDLNKTADPSGRINTISYTPLFLADDYEAVTCGLPPTDIAVTKTVSDSGPETGDTVTYTVDVVNLGPTIATGIKITDVLPAGLAYVSHSPDKGTYSTSTDVWDVGGLTVDGTATLTITVTVTAPSGTTITNTAEVTGIDQPEFDLTNNIDDAVLTVGVTPADIRGAVYDDTDGSALIGGGDTPIGGVTVTLYADDDGDGVPDGPALAVTTTKADGTYLFANRSSGRFLVVETDPTNYDSVTDVDGLNDNQITVVLDGSGTDSNGNDFLDVSPLPPVAVDDESLANPAGPVTLNAVDGSASAGGVADADPNGDLDPASVDLDPATAGVQSTLAVAGEGEFVVDATGNVTFTPEAGFTLDPTPIPYTVSDDTGLVSNEATITIDYVPVATDDASLGNTTGTPVTVDVLANDMTGDVVDPTTVQIVGTTNPGDDLVVNGEGTWSVDPTTGAITFTPEAGFTGDPTDITYTVDDDEGNTSNPAVVAVDYAPQPPVAVDDSSLNNPVGTAVSLNIIDGSASAGGAADADPDGTLDLATIDLDPSTAGIQTTLTVAGEGEWTVDAAGAVTFTPDAGFVLDPTPIPYTVSDNDGNPSNQATITVDYVDPTPGLVLTKTAAPTGASSVDEVITYSFSVENTGNVTLTNVVVADPLLPSLACSPVAVLLPGATTAITCSAGTTYTVTQSDIDDNGGGDGDIDNTATATGTSPVGFDISDDASVAVTLPAQVGDFVWLDLNNDGVQDAGEPGYEGVTVNLLDANGNIVDTAVTGPSGAYLFTAAPGDYRIVVTGASSNFSPQDATGDALDSDVNASGATDLLTLASGSNTDVGDAGIQSVSIGDFVWRDLDEDGIQDAGEPGIDGVTVNLYAADGTTLVATTTTVAGVYEFPGLTPGLGYVVEVISPDAGLFTATDQGTDDQIDSDVDTSGRVSVTPRRACPAEFGALTLTGADAPTVFPTIAFAGGGIQRFGGNGAVENFDASYTNGQSPFPAHPDWTGTVRVQFEHLTPADPDSNSFHGYFDDPSVRVTSLSDFNWNNLQSDGGQVYRVNGRGGFFTSPTTTVRYTLDFTGLALGYLPAGTHLAFTDIDGPANGENWTVGATGPFGANAPFLTLESTSITASPQSPLGFDGATGTYSFDAAVPSSNGSVAYVTSENVTTLTMLVDQPGGASTSFKTFGPLDCDNTTSGADAGILPVPEPPVAIDDESLANPAGPVTLNVLDGSASTGAVADSDPNDNLDPATVDLDPATPGVQSTLTVPGEGEFTVDATGDVTFTPEAGFTLDPTPIPYTVSDTTGLVSNEATITIDYVPVATDDASTGNTTGTPAVVDVLGNDTTGDSVDPTTVQIVGTTNPGDDLVVAGEGTWSVDPATGAITFTPEAGFIGDPTDITYTVDDDEGNTSNPAVVAVDYDQLPPVAVDDASLANPAGPVALNVLDGSASAGAVADSDPNGDLDPATVDLDPATPGQQTTLTVAGEGEFTVDATGNVTFTPEAGFTLDPTPIPYTVSDETGLVSNEATITIDYVPVATDDASTGNTTGTPAVVDVLANDTTGDSVDPTTVQIVGTTNPGDDLVVAGEGTWSVDPATGAITFTPEAGFTDDPTDITYTVDDDEGNTSNPAVVSVDYDPQPPVAVDDESLANPAGPVALNAVDGTASAGGVADSDPDGTVDVASVDLDPATPGQQTTLTVAGEGAFAVDATGNVTFTPEAGFALDPTPIPYTVSDNDGNVSNAATITIDYVPVATDDASTDNATNTPAVVDVLANDTTGDTVDPTTVQIVGTTNPGDDLVVNGEGTWSVDPATGAITFTPEAGFTDDPADITYTVDDDEGNTSNPAVVSVTYAPQPPVAVDDESLANPAGPVTLNAVDGTASAGGVADSDPDGTVDVASVDLDPATPGIQTTLTVAGEGAFAVDATGNVTFTPEAGFALDPTPIPYTVSDNDGNVSNAATITIDYVPLAIDDASTANVTGTPAVVDVLANDTTGDVVDPTTVQIVGTTNPGDDLVVTGEGTWSVDSATGAITFTPEAGFTEDPTDITYTVDDDEGNTSNPAVVSVDYDQLPPVAVDDVSSANPAGPVILNAVDGSASTGGVADSDPNGDLDPATVDLDPATLGIQATLTVAGEGEFTVDTIGNVTFTPEPGFTTDPTPIPYTVSDDTGLVSNEATIIIDYVPVATDDTSDSNPTGTPAVIDVLLNDTTGDTIDPTSVQIVGTTNPGDDLVVTGEGTWSVDPATGAITFTPEAGFTEDPTDITYTVDDDEGNTSNPATVVVDYVPVASDDASTGNVTNTPAVVDVLANDTTGDVVDPTSVQIVGTTNPGDDLVVTGEGTWSVDPATGAITFTPEAGFTEDPTDITYTVDDDEGNTSNPAVVSVDYDPQPPVAVSDEDLGNTIGTTVILNVIDGSASGGTADSDPDGTVDITSVDLDPATPGQQTVLVVAGEGSWSVDGSGVVTFVPEASLITDPTPIPYTISDNDGNVSNEATITIDYVSAAAELTVTKAGVYNGTGEIGDTIDYTITILNSGNVNVFDTVVTDTQADAGSITYDVADDGDDDLDIDQLAPGDSATVAATHTITQIDLDAGSVTNTAVATGQDPQGDPVDDDSDSDDPVLPGPDDPTVTPVPQDPELTLTKTDTSIDDVNVAGGDGVFGNVGDVVQYTFTVENVGNVTLTDVMVEDLNATVDGGPIATLTPDAPGNIDSTTFTATHVITQPDVDAGQVVNQATATALDPGDEPVTDLSDDPDTPAPDDPTVVPLNLADVSVVKAVADGSTIHVPGEQISYSLVVTNDGPMVATNTVVTDTLPADATFVASTPSCDDAAGVLTCDLGDLAVDGTVTVTVDVLIGASSTASQTNVAEVASDVPDPDASNNVSTVTTTAAPEADLAVVKTGPATYVPGSPITYTLTATNNGPSEPTAGIVTDTLPDGVTFVPDPASSATCSEAAGTVTCTQGGAWPTGTDQVFTIVVDTDSDLLADLTNTAVTSSELPDPDPSNNTSTLVSTVAPAANLVVDKSGPATPVASGTQFDFSITVLNEGPSDALSVALTDVLPAGLSYVDATVSGGSGTEVCDNSVACDLGTIAAGVTKTITLTVQAGGDATGDVVNVATATTDTPGDDPLDSTDSHTVVLNELSNLAITKVDDVDPAEAGGLLRYTLALTNAGPSQATNVTVTDTLPAETVFVSADAGCSESGGVVTCDAGTVAVGATPVFQITVRVLSSVADGTQIANTAVVAADSDSDTSDNTTTETTAIVAVADLSVVKTSTPKPFVPGNPVTYTISVFNSGPSDALNVVLTDPLPADFTATSVTTDLAPGTQCTLVGQDMTCPVGTLAASDQVVITVVGLTDPAATALENTATASTDTTDSDPTNDSATDVNDGAALADLVVTKTDDADPVVAGAALSYTINVVNNGPSAARDVLVTDVVPTGFTVDSVDRAECDTSVSCTFATILAGGSETIIVSGTVSSDITDTGDPAAPELSNTVTVSSSTTDPVPDDNTDTETTDVVESANVQLTKIEQGSDVTPGGQLIFTIQVNNAGPSDADDVVVTDTLPLGLTFVSADGATCAPTADPMIVTCDLGTLTAGAPAVVITVTTDVDPGVVGTLTNAAFVTSTTPDPVPEDNDDTSEDPTAPDADLSITKTDLSDPVLAGSNLTYVLSGQNSGPSDAVNVVVSDPLPAGTEFVAATFTSGTGSCAADALQVVTCDLGTLAAGDSYSIDIEVTVDAATADGTVLSNTATISADTTDTDPSDNTSTEDTTVIAEADVGVTKVANFATVTPGESIEYEIRVTNFGPSDAQNVSISDDLPAGLSNVTATPSSGSCTLGTPLTCDLGTVAVGDDVVITIAADVDPAQLAELDNTVTVTTTTDDPNPDNDVATTATPVDPTADLSLVKDVSLTEVVAGTAMSYSVLVTNNGPSDAVDVEIADTLPPGVTLLNATITDAVGNCTGTAVVTCTLPALAAGTQVGVTLDVQVDADVLDGTLLTNTATVSASTADDMPDNNTDTADTDVVAEADLTILKVVDPDPFVPGQPLTFTITVTNNGPSDAQSVTVSDPVPAGLTVTSALATVGTCQVADPITCDLGTLAPASTITITIVADTDPSIDAIVSNTATVTSPTDDPDPSSNESTDTTTPMPTADLVVTKVADLATVVAGAELTYSVTLSNAGISTAASVELIDVLPNNVTYVSHTQTSTLGTCDYETAAQTVRCTAAALVPGDQISIDITVMVDSDSPAGSTVVNTATKTSTTPDPESDNDESTTTTPVETIADLAIDKTLITTPLVPGQSAQYSLVVTNSGPSDAADVEVADTMPTGLTITAVLTTQGSCADDGLSTTCDLGGVAAGATVTITVTVDVAADVVGDVVNTATVTTTTDDPNPDDNEDTTTDTPSPSADLVITKTTVNTPVPGRSVDYVLSVSNGGPSDALDVVVSDTLVDGLVATAAVSDQGTCSIVDGTITCDVGTVVAGASFNVTISADIDPVLLGTLVNTATVESPTTPDPDPDNNTSTVDDPLRPSADLELVKTVTPDPFVPGEPLTYTLTITNAGPSDAVTVTATDTMPTGVTPVTVETPDGQCTIVGASVTCTIATVAAGDTVTVAIVADTDPALTDSITNTASVTAITPDPIPVNNAGTVPADPTPQADVSVDKSGPSTAIGGSTVTYTITATNNGASTATGVVITDTLDTSMTFVSATAGCSEAAGVVTCAPVDLAPGADRVVEVLVELADISQPDVVTNTANAVADTPDPVPGNNLSSVDTDVTPDPATITGIVWFDANANGVREPGESDLSGVRVEAVCPGPDGVAGTADDMIFTAVTASPFVITGVPIQACTVRVATETLPASVRQTFDPDGVLDHITIATITVPGQTATVSFGYTSNSEIPATGRDSGVVLRLALLLLALGGALLVFGRRRRHTTTAS